MEIVEGADTGPTQVNRFEQMAQFVNKSVNALVTSNSDDNATIQYQEVMTAEDMEGCVDPTRNNLIEDALRGVLGVLIPRTYNIEDEVAAAVAKETAAAARKEFGDKQSSTEETTPEDYERLEAAFTRKYIGNASVKFRDYLERCWDMYRENLSVVRAPYLTVVQSSGFGKSRMLYELARMVKSSSKMKVLYVCARKEESTGYPRATTELRDWLFPRNCTESTIATRLRVIFQHAVDNWKTVQDEWLQLFTSTDASIVVTETFQKKTPPDKKPSPDEKTSTEKESLPDKGTSGKKKESSRVVIVVVDEARSLLADRDKSVNNFRLLRRALNSFDYTDGGVFGVLVDTNSKISDLTPPLFLDPSGRGRRDKGLPLFPPFVLTHTMDVFWKSYCDEQALRGDNDVMDMDMDMEEKAPAEAADEMMDIQMSDPKEMRRDDVGDNESKEMAYKDAVLGSEQDAWKAYKGAVLGSEDDAWNALVRMGRPLWHSYIDSPKAEIVHIAARKLLVERDPTRDAYMKENMFGVASLLCRVGLRPHSTSSFGPRAVADLMAILAYVYYEQDSYLISYASDPVLTLGAIKVWHRVEGALSSFILPQLKSLILSEALDTGAIGEVVARIVLLLAMDKCVVEVIGQEAYTGQFMTVHAFLEVLGVEKKKVQVFTPQMRAAYGETKNAFDTWLSKWAGWQMGFSHFVQLTREPTEDTLWYLLGRRAAGIFPRNQKGADLLIPIFWKKTAGEAPFDSAVDAKVSLMLIQVKNRSPHDGEFPKSATTKLCPSFVFGEKLKNPTVPVADPPLEISAKGSNQETLENPSIEKGIEDPAITKLVENPLSKKSVRDVICIYMNVQNEDNTHYRFIYATKIEDNSNDGSGAKLVDTSSKTKTSKSMEAPSSGGRIANVTKSKTGGSKRKASRSKAGSAATPRGPNDSKPTPPSELMFTFCYRSVSSDAYPFLDTEVAGRLASLIETLWDPLALVDGDLKHRHEVEASFAGDKGKAVLSRVIGDEELRGIARDGLADPLSRHKFVVDDKSSKVESSNQGSQRAGLRKHQRHF